ncbi:hypothetical protein JZ751_024690 [Albula glossodonta]|uniref:Uncharacterized protein n=1 Tax=Albula glossodonta TaxID=121402 RepID=A0A8T2PI23_9TELE|nr:hypothetical protein JZ751_024690 [Albula glossodonta]
MKHPFTEKEHYGVAETAVENFRPSQFSHFFHSCSSNKAVQLLLGVRVCGREAEVQSEEELDSGQGLQDC